MNGDSYSTAGSGEPEHSSIGPSLVCFAAGGAWAGSMAEGTWADTGAGAAKAANSAEAGYTGAGNTGAGNAGVGWMNEGSGSSSC